MHFLLLQKTLCRKGQGLDLGLSKDSAWESSYGAATVHGVDAHCSYTVGCAEAPKSYEGDWVFFNF